MQNKSRFILIASLLIAAVVSVASAAPGSFNLLTPADDTVLASAPASLDITWEESTGATGYTFDLDRPVSENVTLTGLTPGDDSDNLLCSAGTCTLSIADTSTVLTEDGVYSWTVVATDGVGDTPATNNPFSFTLGEVGTVPGAFDLVSPADGTTLTEVPASIDITWTESTGAETYTFDLDRPVSTNLTLAGLTPAADIDALTCASSVCTLTITDATTALSESGEFSWTVTATNITGDTAATNNPFTFTVDLTVEPGAFSLLTPLNNAVVRNVANLTAITWQLSQNAISYNFVLLKLSDNTRLGTVLDVDIAAAECGSTPDVCTLTVTPGIQASLTDGQYSWTVVANTGEGTVEASNAPFSFTVNTGAISLVENGGFEAKTLEGKPDLFPWKATNLSGDKIKCNNELKVFSHTGECAFRFKGSSTENSKIQQNLDTTRIYDGDTLTLNLFANTNISAAGTIAIVKVKYFEVDGGPNQNGKDKLEITLSAPSANGTYEAFTGQLQVDGTAKKVKLLLVNQNTAGKLYLDDVQVDMTPGSDTPVETPTPGAGTATETLVPGTETATPEATATTGAPLIPLP